MLAATFALALLGAAPESTIVLQERLPLALLLSTPTGEIANTSSSDTIRIVSDLVERHTNFFLQIAEAQVVTDCRGRLACLVRQMRPDYNRETMLLDSGTVVPFSEHLRDLRQRKTVYPRFMLIVSNVTLEGQADRLSAVLLDTDAALEYFHSASREDPGWERDTEARINEYAVIFGPMRAQVKSADEARAFIERLFAEGLAPILDRHDHWEPYGAVEISAEDEGVAIGLDGVPIGTTRRGTTRIENVTAGVRRVSVDDPTHEPFFADVTVERGKTARVELELVKRGAGSAPIVRSAVVWGGAGVAAVGAAIVAFAVAREDGGISTWCFDIPGEECRDRARFQTLDYDARAARDGGNPNPPGLLLAPFGYSLAAAGLTWAIGTLVFGEESDPPWIQLAAGLAAGAAAYGLSAALDPAE